MGCLLKIENSFTIQSKMCVVCKELVLPLLSGNTERKNICDYLETKTNSDSFENT